MPQDPGIPKQWPFKQELIQELEQKKALILEAEARKKQERKRARVSGPDGCPDMLAMLFIHTIIILAPCRCGSASLMSITAAIAANHHARGVLQLATVSDSPSA